MKNYLGRKFNFNKFLFFSFFPKKNFYHILIIINFFDILKSLIPIFYDIKYQSHII